MDVQNPLEILNWNRGGDLQGIILLEPALNESGT